MDDFSCNSSVFTKENINKLALSYKVNKTNKELLVSYSKKLVSNCINMYYRELNDSCLFKIGNMCINEAIESFDGDYVLYLNKLVYSYFKKYIYSNNNIKDYKKLIPDYKIGKYKYIKKYNKEPSTNEMANYLKKSNDTIKKIENYIKWFSTIILKEKLRNSYDEFIPLLNKVDLSKEEAEILLLKYKFDYEDNDILNILKLTYADLSFIENNALKKIKKNAKQHSNQ